MSTEHEINEWRDNRGVLLGASIFLTREAVQQLQEGEPVTIYPPSEPADGSE